MKFLTIWGHLKMKTTTLMVLGIIVIAISMKGEALPALENSADPVKIEESQWEERHATSGMLR